MIPLVLILLQICSEVCDRRHLQQYPRRLFRLVCWLLESPLLSRNRHGPPDRVHLPLLFRIAEANFDI